MGTKMKCNVDKLRPEAFCRLDETEDALFCGRLRFVSHLDSVALNTIEDTYDPVVKASISLPIPDNNALKDGICRDE